MKISVPVAAILATLASSLFTVSPAAAQERSPQTPASLFASYDRNRDGHLSPEELKLPRLFERLDQNQDQRLTLEESREVLQRILQRRQEASGNSDDSAQRDLAYGPEPAQKLDVYPHPDAKGDQTKRPVLIWIHGGGWRMGNKKSVQVKPEGAHREGMVFVSIGYRFVPDVTMDVIADDIARAIKWVHDNIQNYGGDPNRMVVAGHSAGAHLAALVCVDPQYLKRHGLSPGDLVGCIPVDTAAYDVPGLVRDKGRLRSGLYRQAFGEEAQQQARFSPKQRLTADANTPPILILHCADRADAKQQSLQFAKAAGALGIKVEVRAIPDKTHATINRELGQPDDPGTKAMHQFLASVMKPKK